MQDHAKCPDINLMTILITCQYLRCDVHKRAAPASQLVAFLTKACNTKVGELDLKTAFGCDIHQDVFHLNVSMHNSNYVTMLDRHEHLVKYVFD